MPCVILTEGKAFLFESLEQALSYPKDKGGPPQQVWERDHFLLQAPSRLVDELAPWDLNLEDPLPPQYKKQRVAAWDKLVSVATSGEYVMTKSKKVAKKAVKKVANPKNGAGRLTGDEVIKLTGKEPSRKTKLERFKLYKEGMTVSQAKSKGLTNFDIWYDKKYGFIKLAA